MNAPQRRGVAIDMDGVILDGMSFHVDAWEKAFATYDVQVDPADLYLLEGIRSREVVEWLCTHRGIELSAEDRDAVAKLKQQIYGATFRVVPLRGGPELVRALAAFGYKLCLVTGTSETAAVTMRQELHLVHELPFLVTSSSIGRGKPAPDPYLKAVELLALPADCCIAIENAPPGVDSARSAGLSCVAVATYLPATALAKANGVFHTIDAMHDWFAREFETSRGTGPWLISSQEFEL